MKSKPKPKPKLKFDELNSLDTFYEPMQIDVGSKQRRRELAEYLIDAILFFFATYEIHDHFNSLLNRQLYQQLLADKVSEAVAKVTGIDSNMSNHIRQLSREVVDTTFNHVDNIRESSSRPENQNQNQNHSTNTSFVKTLTPLSPTSVEKDSSIPDAYGLEPEGLLNVDISDSSDIDNETDYWLSYKRAESIAKNEANTFFNYTEYVQAKENGATQKRWLTMLDNKVRDTHEEVEGQTIGIDEMFQVGNSQMKFPHDWESNPDPKEVIGCRCAVEYF